MKNYQFPSKLEQTGTYTKSKQLEGFGRDELRNHFKMKKHVMKKRFCLNCTGEFMSDGDRICQKCKGIK